MKKFNQMVRRLCHFSGVVVLSLAGTYACAGDGFTIEGVIEGEIPDQKIHLSYSGKSTDSTPEFLEADLVDGKFEFSGVIERPPAIYSIGLEQRGMPIQNWIVVLENKKMEMVLRVKEQTERFTLLEQELTGSTANNLFVEFSSELNRRFSQPLEELFGKTLALKPKPGEEASAEQKVEMEKVNSELKVLLDERDAWLERLAIREKDNINSLFALRALSESHQYPYTTTAEVEALFDQLAPSMANSPIAESLKPDMIQKAEVMARSKSVSKGDMFKDFIQDNVDGKPVVASEMLQKGGYLFLDFWASWCAPCRAENPYMMEAYIKYKDKGFEILGISLDSDRDAWLEAIEEDGLPWQQVSDLKGGKNSVAVMYGIHAIPMNYLIDENGKIVATNLKGNELKEVLAEYFGN